MLLRPKQGRLILEVALISFSHFSHCFIFSIILTTGKEGKPWEDSLNAGKELDTFLSSKMKSSMQPTSMHTFILTDVHLIECYLLFAFSGNKERCLLPPFAWATLWAQCPDGTVLKDILKATG